MSVTGEVVREILAEAGVPIAEKGHSVSRGNFNIQCPFCGAADKGAHMGIRLDNGWWGCWRNSEHRGKSPVRLLVAALGKPVWEVRRLLGIQSSPELSTFAAVMANLRNPEHHVQERTPEAVASVPIPAAFRKDWAFQTYASRRFREYMISPSRGFLAGQVETVARDFGLMYALSGDFQDRVIIPYTYRGAVTMWTGRSIHKAASLRYRDLDKETSTLFKDSLVYNYDRAASGGRALVVAEGPFDVIKAEWSAHGLGVHFVGLSTNSVTEGQALQIAELASAYDLVYVAMDTPTAFAAMDSYRMVSTLRGVVDAQPLSIAPLGKDLGGASVRDIFAFFKKVLADHAESL